jgi:hypothetical protein
MEPIELILGASMPQQTRTYKPVSHKELIEKTYEEVDRAGFAISNEYYSIGKKGNQATGRYSITYGNDPDMTLMIAWQNSYDKSLSMKYAIGGHVFVCTNGCVSGDLGAFKKKHMGDIQTFTPPQIREYLNSAGETYEKLIRDKERMKEIEISKRVCSELAGRLFIEEEIITSTQLNILKREIENPSYNYGAPNTLWELYNGVTYALKESSPQTWLTSHIKTHDFFTKEYEV